MWGLSLIHIYIIPPTMPYFLTQTALCFLLAIFPPLVEVPLKWFGG